MELPFHQQLVLTLIDKAGLLAATVVGGFIVSRTIERYKAHQSLLQGIAPERIRRIAEVHQQVHQVLREADTMATELLLAMDLYISEQPVRILTPEESTQRRSAAWEHALKHNRDDAIALSERTRQAMDRVDDEEFWLGKPARDALHRKAFQAMLATHQAVLHMALVDQELRSDPQLESMTAFVERRWPQWFGGPPSLRRRILQRIGIGLPRQLPNNVEDVVRAMVK